MPDISCPWQDDFALDPTGDLSVVQGVDLDNEHIVRRLMTALRGYLWHEGYGAGLPQRVGRTTLDSGIKALVRSQLQLEATVARIPAPVITTTFKADANGLCSIGIRYTDATSGLPAEIALEVPTGR